MFLLKESKGRIPIIIWANRQNDEKTTNTKHTHWVHHLGKKHKAPGLQSQLYHLQFQAVSTAASVQPVATVYSNLSPYCSQGMYVYCSGLYYSFQLYTNVMLLFEALRDSNYARRESNPETFHLKSNALIHYTTTYSSSRINGSLVRYISVEGSMLGP